MPSLANCGRAVTLGMASVPQCFNMALKSAATAGDESKHDDSDGGTCGLVEALKLAGLSQVDLPESES